MTWLGKQPNTIFLGQTTVYGGSFMGDTISHLPKNKRLELPVIESFQMQFTIGLALQGHHPVSIYPRINFLLLAMGDIVNTLDKWKELTGRDLPIIIRTAIGPEAPINPGPQHTGDYSESLFTACKNINVFTPKRANGVFNTYKACYEMKRPVIIVEDGRLY